MKNRPTPFVFWLPLVSFIFCLLTSAAVTSACPGCKDALIEPKEAPRRFATARGYAASIGLMLAVPATLVGGTTVALMRASKKNRSEV